MQGTGGFAVLEGGYHPDLVWCVKSFVEGFTGETLKRLCHLLVSSIRTPQILQDRHLPDSEYSLMFLFSNHHGEV